MGLRRNSNSTHFRLGIFQLFIIFPSYVMNKSVQKYTIKENKNEIQQNNNNNINNNQRKTIVNSWIRCLENNQVVITSGFPTMNFRK